MPLDLQLLVKDYLNRQGIVDCRFKNNLPGIDWLVSFSKRHNLTKSSRYCEAATSRNFDRSSQRILQQPECPSLAYHHRTPSVMMKQTFLATQGSQSDLPVWPEMCGAENKPFKVMHHCRWCHATTNYHIRLTRQVMLDLVTSDRF